MKAMKPETFALITGAVVGTTGVLGMISPLRRPIGNPRKGIRGELKLNSGYGKIVGAIPTNNVFNWLRVGIGATGILASRKRESAVIFNRFIAADYALMAVMGLIPKTNTMFGLMPIYGGNVVLHSGTALGALFAEDQVVNKADQLVNKAVDLFPLGKGKSKGAGTKNLGLKSTIKKAATAARGLGKTGRGKSASKSNSAKGTSPSGTLYS